MANYLQYVQDLFTLLSSININEISPAVSTSFILITAAEIGDKSQLVCMTLAARHRAIPVFLGALLAFIVLNSVAVIFGSAIASWFPDYIISATVALLFAGFGIHALFFSEDVDQQENVIEKSSHNIFFSTFLLITVAEFADKTQLAVVALSSTHNPVAIWIGATLALAFTSALGIIVGTTIFKTMSLSVLHKISGIIFLILATLAIYNVYLNFP